MAWPRRSSCCHSSISMCFHLGGEESRLSTVQSFPNEVMLMSSEVDGSAWWSLGVHICSSVLSELTLPPRCRPNSQFVLIFFFFFFNKLHKISSASSLLKRIYPHPLYNYNSALSIGLALVDCIQRAHTQYQLPHQLRRLIHTFS